MCFFPAAGSTCMNNASCNGETSAYLAGRVESSRKVRQRAAGRVPGKLFRGRGENTPQAAPAVKQLEKRDALIVNV